MSDNQQSEQAVEESFTGIDIQNAVEEAAEEDAAGEASPREQTLLECRDLSVWYHDTQALNGVDLEFYGQRITAIIGPSGCGKSTLLRCVNRMNDLIDAARVEGQLFFEGKNVYDEDVDPVALRRRIGMVFQKPNPFPKTIYDNVAYGLKIQGLAREVDLDERVEWALKRAALWSEVKDKLHTSGLALSGGQQQRLCIARAIAVEPEVLLMDEPASALDPIATGKIEDLLEELRKDYTIVIVTHNMQQAARVSDYTAFLHLGELVEYGDREQIFTNPRVELTEKYITGRFG